MNVSGIHPTRGRNASSGRSRAPKQATEQPGNSFRYLYWRLSEKEFQQLCGALLRHKFDHVQCYPVGMADEGIDAISDRSTIYQVKWSSKLEQRPDSWLTDAIEGERAKIERLVRDRQISRYILMTSVAGTTTAQRTGSIQKLQLQLDRYTEEFGIPVECWWQADIDAEVDASPDSIKWSYQEMLAGSDAIRYLIFGSQVESEAARMRDTMLQVMATQWRDDSKIKFSQVDMDRVNVADLFVDVNASLLASPRRAASELRISRKDGFHGVASGAVQQLLTTTVPLTFLQGVPGQGKSTLGQYLCQIHRAAILPGDMLGDRKAPLESLDEPKLPIRVDLRDYAAWISGLDPFDDEDPTTKTRMRPKSARSLEMFLSYLTSVASGGRSVTVEEVQSLLARFPTLLVLDGLDEVADSELRTIVVDQINLMATRMGGPDHRVRRFQILVTSRPNASGLAEPDGDIFQTLRLEPLTATLQSEFVNKWCDANEIDGKPRQNLRRIFRDRTSLDHVAQLADNPMQLAILLFLINRKGEAVPVSRTPMYTDYMETLLDREVNRQQIDRDQVPRVQEVTAFLGWHMQSGVEAAPAAGSMSKHDIETTLLIYFRQTGGPDGDASTLFKAASDRFWALTSKIDGTFEFAVQPVREFFAAKFLADWAGQDRREPLSKQVVLRELIKRSYWLNTARFYAGFASPNELAALRYGLEEALAGEEHPLQERAATWTLLTDGIFANNLPVQRDVVHLLTDDLTVSLVSHDSKVDANFPRLPMNSGGEQFAQSLKSAVEARPSDSLAQARVKLLRDRANVEGASFAKWWLPKLKAAIGTNDETTWLWLGARFGTQRIPADVANCLNVTQVDAQQAALSAGVAPEAGTDLDRKLVGTVLGGHASDLRSGPTSEAGSLLRAMRPQWFHQIGAGQEHRQIVQYGHLDLMETDKSSRAAAWKRLEKINPEYLTLKKAARIGRLGQKGTTEPWQNPARELTRIHGPSWLAAEIAVAGAAASRMNASGSQNHDGEPFGDQVDYGTFVFAVHRHPAASWWKTMYYQYSDELSRRTWALALVASAPELVLSEHIGLIDQVLASLSAEDFIATASSSSRIGLSGSARSLSNGFARSVSSASPRTHLLLAHFYGSRQELHTLNELSDTDLASLVSPHAAAWPVAQALSVRMLSNPNSTVIEALRNLGADYEVGFRVDGPELSPEYTSKILQKPSNFPTEWVSAAERWRSLSHEELALEEFAVAEQWLPKVPRL